jgi:hypothetical protein
MGSIPNQKDDPHDLAPLDGSGPGSNRQMDRWHATRRAGMNIARRSSRAGSQRKMTPWAGQYRQRG